MQKNITLLTLLLIILKSYIVSGQVKDVFNTPYKYISLKNEKYTGDKKFNFSTITIIDARADTSKIGFHAQKSSLFNAPEIRRLNFKNGLTADVTNFLLNYYNAAFSDNENIISIVAKKLWVSQYDTTLTLGSGLIASGRIFITKMKLEIYLKNKEYFYPIARIDTSFITTVKRSTTDFGYEIIDGIINSCEKFFTINIPAIMQRKKYTLAQIDQFNSRIFENPIINTNKYKKGVYANFSEFLNNEPSLDYKNIDKQKYGDVLYLNDGSGKEYASNKFWGYCDGEYPYIISGKNFFKLVRIQNTFEFYGIKNLRERFYNQDNFPIKRKPAMDMFIYQVDMETGETY